MPTFAPRVTELDSPSADTPAARQSWWSTAILVMVLAACSMALLPANARAATNLALNRPVVVTSFDGLGREGRYAVDGDLATRWSSGYSAAESIYVDLGSSQSIGQVRLSWEAAYATAFKLQVSNDAMSWSDMYSTTSGTGGVQTLTVSGTGRYVRMLGITRATVWGYSLWEFEIFAPAAVPPPPATSTDLALNRPTFVSSKLKMLAGKYAVDGNPTTRWSSVSSDPQWIYIDLGSPYAVNRVKLTWQAAYARSYLIQTSSDASTWTTLFSTTTGAGGVNDISGLSGTGRYVRMYGTVRGTSGEYSLWSFEVYGAAPDAPASDTTAPTPPTALTATTASTSQIDLAWGASSDDVGVTGYIVYRGSTQLATLGSTARSYSDTGLAASTSYTYSVKARDAAGNTSAASNSVSATTAAAPVPTPEPTPPPAVDLALNRPTVASSIESSAHAGSYAVDGNSTTRWASVFADPQWIYVDLGSSYAIDRVKLVWEMAYGKAYQIQVSSDAANWTTMYSTTSGTGGVNDISGLSGTGRYVRMYGTVRGTAWGYSLWSFEVFGTSAGTSPGDTTAPTAPSALTATAASSSQINLAWGPSGDDVGVTSYVVYRGSTQLATLGSTVRSYSDTGLAASTSYSYTVRARDAAGNTSSASNIASATTAAAPEPAPTPGTRDPRYWPFATSSPWNMPIGSGVQFESTTSKCTQSIRNTSYGATVNSSAWSHPAYIASFSDPIGPLYQNGVFVRNTNLPPGLVPSSGSDANVHIINPSGRYVDEMWVTTAMNGGWNAKYLVRNDVYGSGVNNGVRAAGVSAIGGLIRSGEFSKGIPHAVALAVTRAQQQDGYIWPATSQDNFIDSTYAGGIRAGQLMAIPGHIDVTTLGLSPQGLQLARAMQNYGAYNVDSAGNVAAYAEPKAAGEVGGAATDIKLLRTLLVCVTNNTPSSVGGGGTPRVPLAPPLGTPPSS